MSDTNTKHTPLPWRFGDTVGKRPKWEYVRGANGCDVARITQATGDGFGPSSQFEAESNAAFIVRACNAHEDLLAACQRFLDAHQAAMNANTAKAALQICQCSPCCEARAAIAKASPAAEKAEAKL